MCKKVLKTIYLICLKSGNSKIANCFIEAVNNIYENLSLSSLSFEMQKIMNDYSLTNVLHH